MYNVRVSKVVYINIEQKVAQSIIVILSNNVNYLINVYTILPNLQSSFPNKSAESSSSST